jgi:hypothetical protein
LDLDLEAAVDAVKPHVKGMPQIHCGEGHKDPTRMGKPFHMCVYVRVYAVKPHVKGMPQIHCGEGHKDPTRMGKPFYLCACVHVYVVAHVKGMLQIHCGEGHKDPTRMGKPFCLCACARVYVTVHVCVCGFSGSMPLLDNGSWTKHSWVTCTWCVSCMFVL